MNTNIQIHKYKEKKAFKRRLNHVLREKNLSTSTYADREFLNVNEVFSNKKIQNIPNKTAIDDKNSRTYLTKIIGKLRQRIKGAKKESTKIKLAKELELLIKKRDSTARQRTGSKHIKNNFVEITFSITKSNEYVRNVNFHKDLNGLAKEFISIYFPNMDLIANSQHFEQYSVHTHIAGQYLEGFTISEDLENSFGDSQSYHHAQKKFNEFIRNSFMVDKYKLKIDKVVGQKYYPNGNDLAEYKKSIENLDKETAARTKKIVKKIKDKNFVTKKTILGLGNDIKEVDYKGAFFDLARYTNQLEKNKIAFSKLPKIYNKLREYAKLLVKNNKKLSYKNKVMEEDLRSYGTDLSNAKKKIHFINKKYQILEADNNNLLAVLEQYEQKGLATNEFAGLN